MELYSPDFGPDLLPPGPWRARVLAFYDFGRVYRINPEAFEPEVIGISSVGPGIRIAYGTSPRGTIALDRCARAHAWLNGRDFVAPEDVHAIAHDVLRHRILLDYGAKLEGLTPDLIVAKLLESVPAQDKPLPTTLRAAKI